MLLRGACGQRQELRNARRSPPMRSQTHTLCGSETHVHSRRARPRCASRRRRARGATAPRPRADRARAPVSEREIRGREGVALAARPHRDVVGGPRPDAGQLAQGADRLVEAGAAIERQLAVAPSRPRSPGAPGPARAVSPTVDRSARPRPPRPRELVGEPERRDPADRCAELLARARRRGRSLARRIPAGRGSRARRARTGRARPARADPCRARTSGPQAFVTREVPVDRLRDRRRDRTGGARPRRDARARRRRGGARADATPARAERPTPRSRPATPSMSAMRRYTDASRSTASTPGIARGARNVSSSRHASGGRYGTRSSSPPSTTRRSGCRRLARSSLGVNWKTSCTTRFIWRTRVEAGRRRDLRHREIGVVEQPPGEVPRAANAPLRSASRRRARAKSRRR